MMSSIEERSGDTSGGSSLATRYFTREWRVVRVGTIAAQLRNLDQLAARPAPGDVMPRDLCRQLRNGQLDRRTIQIAAQRAHDRDRILEILVARVEDLEDDHVFGCEQRDLLAAQRRAQDAIERGACIPGACRLDQIDGIETSVPIATEQSGATDNQTAE